MMASGGDPSFACLNVPHASDGKSAVEWLEGLEEKQAAHEARIENILTRFEQRFAEAGKSSAAASLVSAEPAAAAAPKLAVTVPYNLPPALLGSLSEQAEEDEEKGNDEEQNEETDRESIRRRGLDTVVPSGTTVMEKDGVKQGLVRETKAWTDRGGGAKLQDQLAEMAKIRNDMRAGRGLKSQVHKILSIGDGVTDPSLSWRDRLKYFIRSNLFENTSCLIIIANAVMIGVEVDWELGHIGQVTNPAFRAINMMFLVLFTAELVLRIVSEGINFLNPHSSNWSWNMFDSVLVLSSLLEEVLGALLQGINTTILRMFRMLRIIRSLRIIRVLRVFKDLRIMIQGIISSGKSLVWAAILLIAIMYLTSVCLLQFASEEMTLKDQDASAGTLDPAQYKVLQEFYPSLFRTVYTLFLCICGGMDWGDAAKPLIELTPFLMAIFCLYISFAVLCVLNIVTGVFVDNATRMGAQDDEQLMLEQVDDRRAWFEEVQELFKAADEDGSGELDGEEFTKKMEDVRLQAWFQKIGVQVESYSAQGLFELLDFSGDGRLTLDEFAIALKSVHGPARSIDLAKVTRDTRMLRRDVGTILELGLRISKAMNLDTAELMDQRQAYFQVQAEEQPAVGMRQAQVRSTGMF